LQTLPDRYLILEVSAELRARQRALLEQLPPDLRTRVHWLESWPAAPVRAVVLANEVADALPFDCFAVREQGLMARGVGHDDAGGLAWRERPADAALHDQWRRLSVDLPAPLPVDYVSEVCPLLDGWLASLLGSLGRGAVLLFDYGLGRGEYYHPSRFAGTLRCHYRHVAHDDPFLHPGLQDITAWVDFTRAAEAAHASGGTVAGYCTQAAFLLGAGLEQELALADDEGQRIRWTSQARQLLMPGEMGETFKAMAITKGIDVPLGGFAVQDLRRLL
jgi:SAM-dependent MidA family methyltransferase